MGRLGARIEQRDENTRKIPFMTEIMSRRRMVEGSKT
jgi:hypothetical protein